ncbi:MAG: hypothetical protein ACRCYU_12600, partial [Nocardioides sp.]
MLDPERLLATLVRLDAGPGLPCHQLTDFRDPAVLAMARLRADRLLRETTDPADFWLLEQAVAAPVSAGAKIRLSKLAQLAIKLARSRAYFLTASSPVFVSLVVPAYGENVRLLARGSGFGADPNGEDFVRQKSAQLEWLVHDTASGYQVIVVDDMSEPAPVTSGTAIARVVAEHDIPHFRVLDLADAVA